MNGHFKEVCEEHGTVYRQCRCAAVDKTLRMVPCNWDICKKSVHIVQEADPELERLLAEEEEIERRIYADLVPEPDRSVEAEAYEADLNPDDRLHPRERKVIVAFATEVSIWPRCEVHDVNLSWAAEDGAEVFVDPKSSTVDLSNCWCPKDLLGITGCRDRWYMHVQAIARQF